MTTSTLDYSNYVCQSAIDELQSFKSYGTVEWLLLDTLPKLLRLNFEPSGRLQTKLTFFLIFYKM